MYEALRVVADGGGGGADLRAVKRVIVIDWTSGRLGLDHPPKGVLSGVSNHNHAL